MNNRRFTMLTACMFILFLAANVVTATVTFTDGKNDVFYYEDGLIDRANDAHTSADVPEIDIHSVSCEVSTGGTTVFLNIGGEFNQEFDEGYDYSIRIYPNSEDITEYYYFHIWTDLESKEWRAWLDSTEHDEYTFNEGTLSIFLEDMFLDSSTVGFEVHTLHYHSDSGVDADWYPDGVEKQSGLDTDDTNDNTDDTSVDEGDSSTTDDSNDDGSSADSPGFEIVLLIAALGFIFVILRRHQ